MASYDEAFTFCDFRPTASCLSLRFNHDQFLLLNSNDQQSSWTAVKGWTKDRNLIDTSPQLKSENLFFLWCTPKLDVFFFCWDECSIYFLGLQSKDLLHVLHQGVATVMIPSLICHHLECKHPGLTLDGLDRLLSKEGLSPLQTVVQGAVTTCIPKLSQIQHSAIFERKMEIIS